MILSTLCGLAAIAAIGAVVTAIGARQIARAHPPAGRFVPVAGGQLHVVELGEARNPAIVLIHGASGNLEDMRRLGDLLAPRWRVILIDRPGHGWSDRPAGDAAASPSRQAAVIAQALDKLHITRTVVVGHSLGGTVAAAFALAQPERTDGVVLLSPVTHPWPGGIAWYYTLTASPLLGSLFAHTVALPVGFVLFSSIVDTVFAPNRPSPDYANRVAARLVLRPEEFVANAADVSALYDFVVAQSPHYSELKMPVRIVSGDTDDVVSVNIHSRALAVAVTGARLTVLPGVGHMVHQVAPEVVVDAVEAMARDRSTPAKMRPEPAPQKDFPRPANE